MWTAGIATATLIGNYAQVANWQTKKKKINPENFMISPDDKSPVSHVVTIKFL